MYLVRFRKGVAVHVSAPYFFPHLQLVCGEFLKEGTEGSSCLARVFPVFGHSNVFAYNSPVCHPPAFPRWAHVPQPETSGGPHGALSTNASLSCIRRQQGSCRTGHFTESFRQLLGRSTEKPKIVLD